MSYHNKDYDRYANSFRCELESLTDTKNKCFGTKLHTSQKNQTIFITECTTPQQFLQSNNLQK